MRRIAKEAGRALRRSKLAGPEPNTNDSTRESRRGDHRPTTESHRKGRWALDWGRAREKQGISPGRRLITKEDWQLYGGAWRHLLSPLAGVSVPRSRPGGHAAPRSDTLWAPPKASLTLTVRDARGRQPQGPFTEQLPVLFPNVRVRKQRLEASQRKETQGPDARQDPGPALATEAGMRAPGL